jgi:hypothetical protein
MQKQSKCRKVMHNRVVPLLWLALLASGSLCQDDRSKTLMRGAGPVNVQVALANIRSGTFTFDDIETLFEAKSIDAIPTLENQFESSQDSATKSRVATALVKLGDSNDRYWQFLIEQATPAIADDAPFFLKTDENGKLLDEKSPEFSQWAKDNHISSDEEIKNQLYSYPGAVLDLGATGDKRSIPYLRRALLSPNFLTQISAAQGLAGVQDEDSVRLIIDACQKDSAEIAAKIAVSLVYFDDDEAHKAVDLYVPKAISIEARKGRAAGGTPFGDKALPSEDPK